MLPSVATIAYGEFPDSAKSGEKTQLESRMGMHFERAAMKSRRQFRRSCRVVAVLWPVVAGSALLWGCASKTSPSAPTGTEAATARAMPSIDCEIAIVGGGVAGVYTAYRLAPSHGSRLCLFEKEEELGGRLRDESLGDDANGVRIGTGARRVSESHSLVLALAQELGLEFEVPESRSELIHTRGRYGYSPTEFLSAFPGLRGSFDDDPDTDRQAELDELVLAKRASAEKYPDFRTYLRQTAGYVEFEFFRSMVRFQADFEYPLSTANYLEMWDYDMDNCCIDSYVVGGMSMFIRKMEDALRRQGVRIYKSEPVLEFESNMEAGYRLRTPARTVTAKKLVIAAPPTGVDRMGGELAEQIRRRAEYKALLPIPIVVINQWWPKAWWLDVRRPGSNEDTALTWRAWTSEHCVAHVEIPQEPYAASAMTTRSVYADHPMCVFFWQSLLASGGISAVEEEVVRGLQMLFRNDVSDPDSKVVIPKPIKTSMHSWEGGWYYIRAGTTLSNVEIARWSIEPLPGRKDLMLVGEAYWPNRPGWVDGALRSVNALLDARQSYSSGE